MAECASGRPRNGEALLSGPALKHQRSVGNDRPSMNFWGQPPACGPGAAEIGPQDCGRHDVERLTHQLGRLVDQDRQLPESQMRHRTTKPVPDDTLHSRIGRILGQRGFDPLRRSVGGADGESPIPRPRSGRIGAPGEGCRRVFPGGAGQLAFLRGAIYLKQYLRTDLSGASNRE